MAFDKFGFIQSRQKINAIINITDLQIVYCKNGVFTFNGSPKMVELIALLMVIQENQKLQLSGLSIKNITYLMKTIFFRTQSPLQLLSVFQPQNRGFFSIKYLLKATKSFNIIFKVRNKVFQFIINYEKISMKSKQSSSKKIISALSFGETYVEDSQQSALLNQRVKNSILKIDLTITSFSQNQISTPSSSIKQTQNLGNLESDQEQAITNKKLRKSNKKKTIEKNIILRSRNRDGKSSRIMKKKEEQKRKRLERKALKLKQKLRKQKMKQKSKQKKNNPSIQIEKAPKITKSVEKDIKINFDDCAEIRQIGFDRKQIQKKRNDLMKRQVDDWQWLQKSRSEKRQLRIFGL